MFEFCRTCSDSRFITAGCSQGLECAQGTTVGYFPCQKHTLDSSLIESAGQKEENKIIKILELLVLQSLCNLDKR